eukprot:3157333-Amphidinium_carterae.1
MEIVNADVNMQQEEVMIPEDLGLPRTQETVMEVIEVLSASGDSDLHNEGDQELEQPMADVAPVNVDGMMAPLAPPPARRRRRSTLDLPRHLVVIEDPFSKRITCTRCACHSMLQSRSSFAKKHWDCRGVPVRKREPRHFLRKASLNRDSNPIPRAEQLLDLEWYQSNGVLPACVRQMMPKDWLTCTTCGARDRPCNRKRFMTKHLACLSEPIIWLPDDTYRFDDTILRRGNKRPVEAAFVPSEVDG